MSRERYSKKQLERLLKESPEDTAVDLLIDLISDIYLHLKKSIREGERVDGTLREFHILLDDLLATPKARSMIKVKVSDDVDRKVMDELSKIMSEK